MGGRMPPEYYQEYYQKNKAKKLAQGKTWAEANVSKNRDYHMSYYRLHWARHALKRASYRARKEGLPFSITAQDVVVPELCPILGIPLVIGGQSGGPNSPSLDRIRGDLGYVPGNVQVISKRANTIKNDATADELRKVAAYVDAADRLLDRRIA